MDKTEQRATNPKPGRIGITYDQVDDAISKLIESNINPTIQNIRTHLGTGSPNTIHRHLSTWREKQPVPEYRKTELPENLKRLIVLVVERQAEMLVIDYKERIEELENIVGSLQTENSNLKQQLAMKNLSSNKIEEIEGKIKSMELRLMSQKA